MNRTDFAAATLECPRDTTDPLTGLRVASAAGESAPEAPERSLHIGEELLLDG